MIKDRVIAKFRECFDQNPTCLVRAPGRVNLIGEHTDYNDGFVLPLAIDYGIWIAFSPVSGDTTTVYSLDYREQRSYNLNDLKKENSDWIEYIKGMAWLLKERSYPVLSWKGVMCGTIPIGAGLSSSAALEMAAGKTLLSKSGIKQPDVKEIARWGQSVENRWIGVNCGIMDQLASAGGVEGHALFIDCMTLELSPVPIPDTCLIAILDTTTRRKLVDSAYNERRDQCEEAARICNQASLRNVTMEQLLCSRDRMGEDIFRRACHVITENSRVTEAVDALSKNDLKRLGRIVNEGHDSLRENFEVSSEALDRMSESANESAGCYGARMTGAGFAGCAMAVIEKSRSEFFVEQVRERFYRKTGLTAKIYLTTPVAGAELYNL